MFYNHAPVNFDTPTLYNFRRTPKLNDTTPKVVFRIPWPESHQPCGQSGTLCKYTLAVYMSFRDTFLNASRPLPPLLSASSSTGPHAFGPTSLLLCIGFDAKRTSLLDSGGYYCFTAKRYYPFPVNRGGGSLGGGEKKSFSGNKKHNYLLTAKRFETNGPVILVRDWFLMPLYNNSTIHSYQIRQKSSKIYNIFVAN